MWYTKAESTPRYGLWYCGLGMGQIVGGLISFGAQHAPRNLSFGGWKIMFVAIGAANILAGAMAFLFLPETPENAGFLTEQEKSCIRMRLREDQAGTGAKVFRWRAVPAAVMDLQTWLLMLLTVLVLIPSGMITTFSSMLIKGFGYTPKESALLNMPSGAVSIIATMTSTITITRGFSRWLTVDILLLITVLGACLMSFMPTTNQGGCLAGIYLVNAVST